MNEQDCSIVGGFSNFKKTEELVYYCRDDKCRGELRKFPFQMLSFPPINQYECKLCGKKYQGREGEQLEPHQSSEPFDWAECYDLHENALNHCNERIRALEAEIKSLIQSHPSLPDTVSYTETYYTSAKGIEVTVGKCR